MKRTLPTLILILLTSFTFAQNGTLSGTVTNRNQSPLFGVSISIKNTKKGTQTNENGDFEIANLKNGDYTLVLSYIGFKTKEISFSISNNQAKNLGGIILDEASEVLQEVLVEGQKNPFTIEESVTAAKLPLTNLENAQVYSTVTPELLKSQLAFTIDDAMVNVAGADKTVQLAGYGSGYALRGFENWGALVDGIESGIGSVLDPMNIERIEVLKGPSATLFGSSASSFGGLTNIITKKPQENFGGSISYTAGSFNTNRISGEVNVPLSKADGLFLRLAGSYVNNGSFQDAGFLKSTYIAPTLLYKPSDKFKVSVALEYNQTKQTNLSQVVLRSTYPMVANNVKDLGLDTKKSFTDNDIYIERPRFNTRTIADYSIIDNWKGQTVLSTAISEYKGNRQFIYEGAASQLLVQNPQTPQEIGTNQFIENYLQNNVLTRILQKEVRKNNIFNGQQNFTNDFKIGTIRNRMIVGFDYYQVKYYGKGSVYTNGATGLPFIFGFFNPNGTPLDDVFFTPSVVETEYPLNQTILNEAYKTGIVDPYNPSKSQRYGVYLSDVINFTPTLSAMFGLRWDRFIEDGEPTYENDGYALAKLSPKLGLVYQPIKDKLSVFANYLTGYSSNAPVTNRDESGNPIIVTFKPVRAKQFETGIKTNLLNNHLALGLSYYNITVNNQTMNDPDNPFSLNMISVDEQQNKGVEFEINANLFKGLNISGAFAYNDSKITETQYASILNTRPTSAGADKVYNFWADYRLGENTPLKGLGFGAGFNGASKSYAMDNNISGKFVMDAYTLFNASVYYDFKKFRVGVKANNIADVTYYKASYRGLMVQSPRTFLGTVVYRF